MCQLNEGSINKNAFITSTMLILPTLLLGVHPYHMLYILSHFVSHPCLPTIIELNFVKWLQ